MASRGIKIRVSLDLLLDSMGVEPEGIELCGADVDGPAPNVLVLTLCGTSYELPEIPEGDMYPYGVIQMQSVRGHIECLGHAT